MIKEKIVINDYIQGDPLSEENLDKTLNLVNRFRLLMPEKTIWLYSGYRFEELDERRKQIVSLVDIFVDGRYIDLQRNISAKWKGSDNQRVISIRDSLQQGKVVLYCE